MSFTVPLPSFCSVNKYISGSSTPQILPDIYTTFAVLTTQQLDEIDMAFHGGSYMEVIVPGTMIPRVGRLPDISRHVIRTLMPRGSLHGDVSTR